MRYVEPRVEIWFTGVRLLVPSTEESWTLPLSRARRVAIRGLGPVGRFAGPDAYAELRDPATGTVLETILVDARG